MFLTIVPNRFFLILTDRKKLNRGAISRDSTLKHETYKHTNKMATFYDGSILYNKETMPKVEGWEESNNCDFVRFHWVCTADEQRQVDAHWRPLFYRHSLINSKMYLASLPGAGVPGWGLDFSKQVGDGNVRPTGLDEDPRLPPHDPDAPRADILGILCDAAVRYKTDVDVKHMQMLADWTARKNGTWAQRLSAAKEPAPTRETAVKVLTAERAEPEQVKPWWYEESVQPGIWRPWEIEEILKEQERSNSIERAWQRAEAHWDRIKPSAHFCEKYDRADAETWETERVRAVFGDQGVEEGKTLEDVWEAYNSSLAEVASTRPPAPVWAC